jgi:hypothetical protein
MSDFAKLVKVVRSVRWLAVATVLLVLQSSVPVHLLAAAYPESSCKMPCRDTPNCCCKKRAQARASTHAHDSGSRRPSVTGHERCCSPDSCFSPNGEVNAQVGWVSDGGAFRDQWPEGALRIAASSRLRRNERIESSPPRAPPLAASTH